MRPLHCAFLLVTITVAAATLSSSRIQAQQGAGISAQAMAQINALVAEKRARSAAERKISSDVLYAAKMARGEAIAQGVPRLATTLDDEDDRGAVLDVRAQVSDALLARLVALGAELLDVSAAYRNIRLRVPLVQVAAIAALPDVAFVEAKQLAMTSRIDLSRGGGSLPAADRRRALKERKRKDRADIISAFRHALNQDGPIANVGSRNSEGDAKHRADVAREMFLVSGAGVKVGVLSDGVDGLAAAQASGDLGAVTVLPGQAGAGAEGTAMLEIIHDLAPNAQLYFATAFTSIASFAQNIRDLRTAGCDIIVDDVGYVVETPFQDGQTALSQTNGGIVIQAVKDVAASGALYFSSAANSGNKDDGTSGTWEGDFVDGGAAGGVLTSAGQLHNFGGQTFNLITSSSTGPITLFWSDPLGASGNDYDIYLLDSSGTLILAAGTNFQTGAQDPFEVMHGGNAGNRIVIVKFPTTPPSVNRFLHLGTNRGRLQIATGGETHGHSATGAINSFGVAATSAMVNGLAPFNGGHVVETFSSDGPRRIFFQANGAAITPGNFSSTGGFVLAKPDFTAADGVSVTGAGGFPSPFFGTSAAAPHAAAIAALVKSKNQLMNAAQIRTALFTSTIDIEVPGLDRDAGAGIVMADVALAQAPTPPPPAITGHPSTQIVKRGQDATFTVAAMFPGVYQWQASTNAAMTWFNVPNAAPFAGVTSATLTIANVGLPFNHVRYRCIVSNIAGSATSQGALLLILGAPNGSDFDGDAKAEITVFRPSTGTWFIKQSNSGYASFVSYAWGLSTDIPLQGDYDGDGKQDLAVFRPGNGTWYILLSGMNYTTFIAQAWGLSTDIPVEGDYDGDGKSDLGVYRPSTGFWYIALSGTNYSTFLAMNWGLSTDQPVPGDYDGDGKADFGIYRPSTGTWWVLLSMTNYTSFISQAWGLATDVTATADYDGDGRIDLGLFRPSTGFWYVLLSGGGYTSYLATAWGTSGDIVVPGDYDADNKADLGVFRPSNGMWYVLLSSGNYSTFIAQPWGLGTDIPMRP